MQRGVLKFDSNELDFFTEILEHGSVTAVLGNKLQSLSQNNSVGQLEIELSEEEVDMLLDYLGIPSKDEQEGKRRLREKLAQLLRTMRG